MSWLDNASGAHSIVESLTASICVIDRDGVIRAENNAWKKFSIGNGGRNSYIGENYLSICKDASDCGIEVAADFKQAITEVFDGSRDRFETEYPCHSSKERRWFLARVTPLVSGSHAQQGGEIKGAVITHQDITKLKLMEIDLKRLADTDGLTGLKNRRYFVDQIDSSIAKLKAGSNLALCLIDLDKFKDVNDTCGHDTGDHMIKQAAARITESASDVQSVVVARMGGDEFAVLMEFKRHSNIVPVADRLIEFLGQTYSIGGETLQAAGSMGIAFYPTDANTSNALMKAADLALYSAKNDGRGRYTFFTSNLLDEVEERTALLSESRSGLERGEFETFFQPIVRLKDKSLVGFEALVRWRHPERGLLTPGQFIAVLTDRRMASAVSQSVLVNTIKHLAAWQREGLPKLRVSVNLTSDQLHNPNFVESLCRTTSAHNVDPRNVKLEITEDVVLGQNTADVGAVLTRLQKAGFAISLDDFGTGYASLSHMSQLPLDEIKIDMSFVRELGVSRKARAVVRSISHLAHELGLSVVAEGIEDERTEGVVAALGCDFGQGYLFGKPQPVSGIPDLVRQWDYPLPIVSPESSLKRSSR